MPVKFLRGMVPVVPTQRPPMPTPVVSWSDEKDRSDSVIRSKALTYVDQLSDREVLDKRARLRDRREPLVRARDVGRGEHCKNARRSQNFGSVWRCD